MRVSVVLFLLVLGALFSPVVARASPEQALTYSSPGTFYLDAPGTGNGNDDQYVVPNVIAPLKPGAHNVVVTIDSSDLAGKATLINDDGECSGKALLTCKVSIVAGYQPLDGLKLSALPGTEPGQSGVVRFRATASDASPVSWKVRVVVGRPELSSNLWRSRTGVPVGRPIDEPVGIRNDGNVATRGFAVLLVPGNDVGLAGTHSNCRYQRIDDLLAGGYCTFPGQPIAPGQSVAFSQPVTFIPQRTLMYGDVSLLAWPLGTESPVPEFKASDYTVRGTGAPLSLVAAQGMTFSDKGGFARYDASNHADFSAYGDTVRGKVGQTVQIKVGTRNLGPGSMDFSGRERSESYHLTFTPPAGTTVTGNPYPGEEDPWTCAPARKGAASYSCKPYGDVVARGGNEEFLFNVRIDRAVPGASGKVQVIPSTQHWPARDTNAANNVAKVPVQARGQVAATHQAPPKRHHDWLIGTGVFVVVALAALIGLLLLRRRSDLST